MSVHAVGGLAALVGCAFIGPRIGKYQAGKHYHLPGHSTPLTGLGGFILITGFLGMVLGHGSNIELSSTNIFLGGAVAGCTATSYKFVKPFIVNFKRRSRRNSKIKKTYWSFLVLVDSCLCGMVALCAGANVVEPYAAACIGFVSALVFLGIEDLIKRNELDDPLGSIAVHMGGGLTGVILLPFFMRKRHGAEIGKEKIGSKRVIQFRKINQESQLLRSCFEPTNQETVFSIH